MADKFDVIVVGGRCAGSPLATLLAREGLRVAVVERAGFPKDTLSTHIYQAPAINFLKRLGVFEKVLETEPGLTQGLTFGRRTFCARSRWISGRATGVRSCRCGASCSIRFCSTLRRRPEPKC